MPEYYRWCDIRESVPVGEPYWDRAAIERTDFDPDDDGTACANLMDEWNLYPMGSVVVRGRINNVRCFTVLGTRRDASKEIADILKKCIEDRDNIGNCYDGRGNPYDRDEWCDSVRTAMRRIEKLLGAL